MHRDALDEMTMSQLSFHYSLVVTS